MLAPKTGQLLREHLRAPRGWHRVDDADRPARTPASTMAVLARAQRAGAAISTVCQHIHQHDGAGGIRRILGVLALAKKHGPAVGEDAAKAAPDVGVPTYRFLRRYIERRVPAPLTLKQVDPLIHCRSGARRVIDRHWSRSPIVVAGFVLSVSGRISAVHRGIAAHRRPPVVIPDRASVTIETEMAD